MIRISRQLRGFAATSAVILLAACSSGGHSGGASGSAKSGSSGSGGSASPASPGAPLSGGMKAFYSQHLSWHSCDVGQCAWLKVPIDYAKPTGPTISVAVNKMSATGSKKGSLVVNPGGPGGSGVDYAAAADRIVTSKVRGSYDIVGFDPRGVQRSAAIRCVSDADMDTFVGADPVPTSDASVSQFIDAQKKFGQQCQKNAGPLLGHVSTVEVAKDMDLLRAALGESKLNYLGKSYGTLIGSTYAGLFPTHVGRMVLDGVIPPDLQGNQGNEGQVKGFQTALDAYLNNCVGSGSCPLGSNKDAAQKKLVSWMHGLDSKPVPISGDVRVKNLTQGWAFYGVAVAMYSKQSWPSLTAALDQALKGDGTMLFKLAESYVDRTSDGTYTGNIMQVNPAVNCLDNPAAPGGVKQYEKDAKTFAALSPLWGPDLAWGEAGCAQWPIKATGHSHVVKADGAGPIVVVGTTRDPATPYAWAKQLAYELSDGRLISYDGDGHTAYDLGSSCVDNAVDKFLVDGVAPAKSTSCH